MSEIDVSKCQHIWINNNKECLAYQDCCDNRPNCYYKQLQQLKIENDELKKTINKLGIEHENYDNLIYWQMKEQQDKLKSENEELKKLNEQLATYYPQENNELLKVKQCLDEIYEICDKELCKGEIKDLEMYAQMEMIIQKIKEVRGNE